MTPSPTRRLAINRHIPTGARSHKVLAAARLRQPPDGPQRLIRLRMRRHTHPLLHRPNLGLAIKSPSPPLQHQPKKNCIGIDSFQAYSPGEDNVPAQQVLARIAPVQRHDPGAVAGEVGDLFTRGDVVQGDDAGVARGGEEGAGRREGDGADGLDETCFGG